MKKNYYLQLVESYQQIEKPGSILCRSGLRGIFLAAALLFGILGQLTRAAAFELTENFDAWNGSSYAQSGVAPWNDGGTRHTYLPAGGWMGSGSAKLLPHEGPNQGYSGLTNFGTINSPRVNIRYLYKIGSGMLPDHGDKNIIIHKNPDADDRSIGLIVDHAGSRTSMDVCENVSNCDFDNATFRFEDHVNEWICIEYELIPASNIFRVYVTTQDGRLNGHLLAQTGSNGSSQVGFIEIMGGYWGDQPNSWGTGTNTWIQFDNLRISSAGYIGPPSGFVSGATPVCGDRTCNGTETCSSCPGDCGTCPDTTPPAAPTGLAVR